MTATNGIQVGLNCHTYRNTATFGSPVWVDMTGIKDTSLTITVDKAEATARVSGYKRYAAALISAPFTFNLLADCSFAEYDVLRAAVIARTISDFAFANFPIASSGTEYWHADYLLFSWKRGEPLEECATIDVEGDLAYSANAPVWTTV